ncbi:MAG: hypothetical protein LV479_00955 [Methylacidiphilales bacterium]|nr:hypothetical protein [Candidatus Methylacidiphilales bacterium]
MTRLQFWILTGLSGLVVLLLIAQIILVRAANYQQIRATEAQQVITAGQASQSMVRQLAVRIYEEAQKTQDPGLKDLVARQQIKYTPPANSSTDPTAPASAASPTPIAH